MQLNNTVPRKGFPGCSSLFWLLGIVLALALVIMFWPSGADGITSLQTVSAEELLTPSVRLAIGLKDGDDASPLLMEVLSQRTRSWRQGDLVLFYVPAENDWPETTLSMIVRQTDGDRLKVMDLDGDTWTCFAKVLIVTQCRAAGSEPIIVEPNLNETTMDVLRSVVGGFLK